MPYTVKEYKDRRVSDVRAELSREEITLEVLDSADYTAEKVEAAEIEKNADTSQVGDVVQPGGVVSVIIFPPEGRG